MEPLHICKCRGLFTIIWINIASNGEMFTEQRMIYECNGYSFDFEVISFFLYCIVGHKALCTELTQEQH